MSYRMATAILLSWRELLKLLKEDKVEPRMQPTLHKPVEILREPKSLIISFELLDQAWSDEAINLLR